MKDNRLKPRSNLGQSLSQCKCGKVAQIRGVCNTCYAKLMHEVEDGKTTELDLIKNGILQQGKGLMSKRDNEMFLYGSRQHGIKNSNTCLVPKCGKLPYRRGLCNTHRVYAHSMLKRGKAKEDDLISRGLLLPANAVRKNPVTPKRVTKLKRRNPVNRRISSATGTCEIKNCTDPQHAKGLCKVHYSRILRKFRKNPRPLSATTKKDINRRSSSVKRDKPPSW